MCTFPSIPKTIPACILLSYHQFPRLSAFLHHTYCISASYLHIRLDLCAFFHPYPRLCLCAFFNSYPRIRLCAFSYHTANSQDSTCARFYIIPTQKTTRMFIFPIHSQDYIFPSYLQFPKLHLFAFLHHTHIEDCTCVHFSIIAPIPETTPVCISPSYPHRRLDLCAFFHPYPSLYLCAFFHLYSRRFFFRFRIYYSVCVLVIFSSNFVNISQF